jgi:hypothetical protein
LPHSSFYHDNTDEVIREMYFLPAAPLISPPLVFGLQVPPAAPTLAPSFVYALPFLPVFASSIVAACWDKERQEPFIVGPHTSAAAFWEKSPSPDLGPQAS